MEGEGAGRSSRLVRCSSLKRKKRESSTGLEEDIAKKQNEKKASWSRAVLLIKRARSYMGPNYRALSALVRDRYGRIEGSSNDKLLYSGLDVLKEASRRFLEEARKTTQRGSAEKFCKRARSRISKAPLGPPEHLKRKPVARYCKRDQDTDCAKAALARYNKRNPGAAYELVEPITSQPFLNNEGIWYHVNFMAKPINDDDASGSSDASPKLFFAELNFTENVRGLCLARNRPLICRCCIVDPNSSETIVGCGCCGPYVTTKIYHVDGSFRFGRSIATMQRPIYTRSKFGLMRLF